MRRHLHLLLTQAVFLTPIVAVVLSLLPIFGSPPSAEAAVSTGASFGSAVACLTGAPPVAVTRHDDTMYYNPAPASYPGLQTLTPGGAPVTQAMLSSIGSVYSLAYDDGAASGKERLFVATYTRRLMTYGPQGAGGIYVFERSGASWVLASSFAVPGVVGVSHVRGTTAYYDTYARAGAGRTALGGMVVSPDGQYLYVVNVGAHTIVRYRLSATGVTYDTAFSINYGLITSNASVRADLYPFALQWYAYPMPNGNPALVVGVTDTAHRDTLASGQETTPKGATSPALHVLLFDPIAGTWATVTSLPLNTSGFSTRLAGSAFFNELAPDDQAIVKGWNPWLDNPTNIPKVGSEMRYPQPLLTDIAFVRETAPTAAIPQPSAMMVLGVRDRTGDIAYNNALGFPAGEVTAIAQGDTIAMRYTSGAWRVVAQDYFADNTLPNDPGSTKHRENMTGSVTRIPGAGTRVDDAGDTLIGLGLAGLRTSGMYAWYDNAEAGGASTFTNTLANTGSRSATKATNLGDVEVLCSYALVGGRVWNDSDGGGVQNAGEVGIAGIALDIVQPSTNALLTSARTDANGRYLFAVPPNTSLQIRINTVNSGAAISGYHLSPQNVGADTTDSDAARLGGAIPFVKAGDSTTLSGAITAPWRDTDYRNYDVGLTQAQPTGFVGDRVWLDTNGNGLQDSNESGYTLPGMVLLKALSAEPGVIDRTTTFNTAGRYGFDHVVPGTYQLYFPAPPPGFRRSPQDQGSDDSLDSDPNASFTTIAFISADNILSGWDYGIIGGADVWVQKSAPATATAGGTFDYTLRYGNTGTFAADTVEVVDALPLGLRAVSASPAPAANTTLADGRTQLTWRFPTVAGTAAGVPAGAITVRVAVTAPFTPSSATRLTRQNCATITTSTPDLDTNNNTACVTTELQRPEVRITKSGPATGVLIGDTYPYTLHYANDGSTSAPSVIIEDALPPGIPFVAWLQNPGNACQVTNVVVTCSLGTLPAGAAGDISFTVRADAAALPGSGTAQLSRNTATIGNADNLHPPDGMPWPGDDPANNSASTDTTIQFPNPGVTVGISPSPFPVGERGTITIAYRNTGSGIARGATLRVSLPTGITLGALPAGCSAGANPPELTCTLGDLAVGVSATLTLPVSLPATFAADRLDVTATITSVTPERPAHLADNTATAGVSVVRPNVFVTAAGPASIVGQGSAFWYTVDYGNQYRANPSLTRAAANVVLQAILPDDVTFVQADVPPTQVDGQILTWDLGTLAANAGGQIHIVVQTSVPAGAMLHFAADISTTTPGDDPSDNHARVDTDVVQPPVRVGQSQSDLTLAIHSDLDPNSQDRDSTNGVYVSEGSRISWPAGEVLDFTPRLSAFSFPDEPLPFPYEYRARVVGWSVAGFTVNGISHDPRAADSRNIAGCRTGARPTRAPQLLAGCPYAYLGGESRTAIENPDPLTEAQLATQAHAYWTQPAAPRMRNDVFLYTLDPLESVQLAVQVEVEVWIVNASPGAINGVPLPEIPVVPLPDPARQLISQDITVNLLIPRSVIGPGSH